MDAAKHLKIGESTLRKYKKKEKFYIKICNNKRIKCNYIIYNMNKLEKLNGRAGSWSDLGCKFKSYLEQLYKGSAGIGRQE